MFNLIEDKKKLGSKFDNPNQSELVIICHGWLSGPFRMKFLTNFFTKKNYSVFRLNLSTTFGSISKILKEAEDQLESIDFGKKYKKVYFIGHSFGGIIIKILLNKYNWETTNSFVSIGTPWGSTPFAKKIEHTIKFKEDPSLFGNGILLLKMSVENKMKNNKIKIGLIGGDKPYTKKKATIDGLKWDGTVPSDSAIALKENVVDKKILHLNHYALINNKTVAVMIYNFFIKGKF